MLWWCLNQKSDPVTELGRWLNPHVTQDRQVKLPAPMSASQLFSSSCFTQVVEFSVCVCVCARARARHVWTKGVMLLGCCCFCCWLSVKAVQGVWSGPGRKLGRLWPQLPQVPGRHFGGVWKIHVVELSRLHQAFVVALTSCLAAWFIHYN